MFRTSGQIIRTVFSSAFSASKTPDHKVLVGDIFRMSDRLQFKKQKYDGRSKKRQWEERKSDKVVPSVTDNKKLKVEDEEKVDKIKRRKYCLLMGYSGVNYFGMQRNPGSQTIEEELFKALYKEQYINESCFTQVQNMQFQRAARTDKGVSAARQIVSLKLPENIDITRINEALPEDVRVFACKRVTKGFNSKSQCDSRTYTYMLPTVAFANQNENIMQKDYRLSNEKLKEINEILTSYVGTKNYHNFTSKKKPNDPSAKRYMKSFVCESPIIRKDIEFAVLKVQGQSFMLHQIRKMVGLLLAIARGQTTMETMDKAFKIDKVCIPRAPGLGLVLEYVHYDRYNFRYGSDGSHETLTWDEVEDKVQAFKESHIYPTIIDTEIREESMVNWIANKLSRHSYDETENESDDEGGADDDDDETNMNNVKNNVEGTICSNDENKSKLNVESDVKLENKIG